MTAAEIKAQLLKAGEYFPPKQTKLRPNFTVADNGHLCLTFEWNGQYQQVYLEDHEEVTDNLMVWTYNELTERDRNDNTTAS